MIFPLQQEDDYGLLEYCHVRKKNSPSYPCSKGYSIYHYQADSSSPNPEGATEALKEAPCSSNATEPL